MKNKATSIIMLVVASIIMSASAAQAKVLPQSTQPHNHAAFDRLSAEAVDDYNNSRYHACADKLNQCIMLDASNPLIYLRLGDTMQQLRDEESAADAYKACFTLDPFGNYGKYAKARLSAVVAARAYKSEQPQDTPAVVAHTASDINRQAADLSSRALREGTDTYRWRMRLAQIEAQKIDQEARMERLTMGNYGRRYNPGYGAGGYGGGYGAGGYGGVGYGGLGAANGGPANAGYGANPFNANEVSDLTRIRTSYIRYDGQVQANNARAAAALKAAYINESAANLKEQLMARNLPGDAHLRALGTSLYVRYYGDETPSYDRPPVPDDPVTELTARAQKMKF